MCSEDINVPSIASRHAIDAPHAGATHFLNLSSDVLVLMLSFLQPADIISASKVNRAWRSDYELGVLLLEP